ncbi:AAA family ATPase [Aquihabitans sp. G128]|uniref:adenylate/guanylate cyclase domain-containing protein n=1 Tax=Aquihabitans sp. G128 TaxID=2849779 RepID=UPI001C2416DA|nr:adenylate/guanylate cyclase domain-containing protein [Aquihabitans sp. G128]QXC61960.1 AAA family ATPase [Aquihabitans sp. G128]
MSDAASVASQRCPACRAPLPAGARFCPGCGRPVAGESAVEERRIVTVVFADLEGFTALAEQRDPESVKELLDGCFGRLVPVIDAHGGHVDKIIGDELMAVFGAPTAHEDDPERAVRAALALVPALAAVDPTLRLRVGVNTGEVMAGAVGPSLGYTVTGDVVNTAHRLCTAAAPGEVLVGERTRQATVDGIGYELRGDLDLKGKADRVRAWVAGGTIAGPAHRGPDGSVMALVGRRREVADLRATVTAAMAERRTEVLTIVGEPGVGKTRLAMELAVLLAAKPATAQVLWVSCPPYGPGGDLAPLADLVRAGLGVSTSADPEAQEALLAERVQALVATTDADAGLLRARLALLLGLGHQASRPVEPETGPSRAGVADQQLGAVRTVLRHLARARPLLVVVDDIHWAGPGLLRFLAQLPEQLADQPIVVLALARDDLLERRAALVGAGPGRSTRTLDPLSREAAGELVRALLVGAGGDPATVHMGPSALDRLVTASGGNPLLLDQLVRYLVESGALAELGGRWQWTTDEEGSEASLPDGVRSLIGARLDALPADERAVVATAAVFGRRFWREALVDLSGTAEVDALLDRLGARGLTQPIEDDGYGDHAFRHVLTRDVAYASLPIGDRALRHARVAGWLEAHVDPAASPAALAQLAHHYERAVVLARSVDHTDPGLAGAAFAALVRAARDEHSREGLRRADHWYRRARDLGSADPEAVVHAVAEHGQVLLELRHLDAAQSAFEEVQRRAAGRHPELEASASAHLGAVARLQGDGDLARDRFEQAAEQWRALGDLQGQVDVLRLQGWSEITAGRPRAAPPRLQRAVALEAQLTEPLRQGDTLRYLGWCEFLSGEIEAALEHLWAAMSHCHDDGDVGAVGWCFGLLAHILLQSGQVTRCLEVARNLRAVARRTGDPWSEWTCANLEAAALLALGETVAAAELAREAERRFDELDEPWGLALSRVVRGQAARIVGDVDEARAVLVEALASSRALSYPREDARLLVELARVELEAGRLPEAERQGRGALALVRAGIGDHESGLRALVVLAEAERERGAADVAELLLEEAAADREPADRTDGWRAAAVALAQLRLAAGDVDGCRELVARCEDPPTEEVRVRAAIRALRARLGDTRS